MGYAASERDRRDDAGEPVYEDLEHEQVGAAAKARHDRRVTAGVLAGASSLETIGGLAAIVLSVIGFSALPLVMAGAATVAVGLALFGQGAAIASRWHATLRKLRGAGIERSELVGGITTEIFAGLAGIVLGALALAGVAPLVLLPVAAIAYGGALLLGGAAQPDLVYLSPERDIRYARATYGAIQTSGGVMVLVGVAASVLGILAVLGVGPSLSLTLVALIVTGAALAFAGGALTVRFARRLS